MSAKNPLHALCLAAGLSPTYVDAWGQVNALSDDALKTLLTGLGVSASPEALAPPEPALAAPRVHVRLQSKPGTLTFAARSPTALAWRIDAETGEAWSAHTEAARDGMHALDLPDDLPLGYHRLNIDGHGVHRLIVCPDRCHEPSALQSGDRWWGPVIQLYAVRSLRNWGIGDFTDLARLLEVAASAGAAFVGLNPLHALFPVDPERASPYGPSHREALNPLYLDVQAVPEYHECEAARAAVDDPHFQQRLAALRGAPHVAYAEVAAAKAPILAHLHRHFRSRALACDTPRAQAFRDFQHRHRDWLRPHALFDALQEHFQAQGGTSPGWQDWPSACHDPHGEAVRNFAEAHAERVEYFEYLQWLCDEQLASAAAAAHRLGMPLGLYRDVAVGVSAAGSAVWTQQPLYALDMSIGAPPEPHNPAGQSWGLPPIRPEALRDAGFEPFIRLLRANMRHAGALRLDHVMALARLFWVPSAGGCKDGSYVAYPFEDLLAILALESVRAQCLVIGEDLGNVPEGFREALAARGVRSYCPLYFQRGADGAMPAPTAWPRQALAVVGTHDLPTLRSWWAGADIDTRERLGLYADPSAADRQRHERVEERAALGQWLGQTKATPPDAVPEEDTALADAVHEVMGRVRSELVGVQLEDVFGQTAPVNVPSTREDQHPNWRVKLEVPIERCAADPRWIRAAAAIHGGRAAGAPAIRPGTPATHVPTSTYRVQFHAGMRFDDVTRAVPYLADLGVGHLYASPCLRAREGSTHGYDVIDPGSLNPEIGDAASHARLCDTLRAHGLRQLLDIVPNHMGVLQTHNPWWHDVLENGAAARHATTFDIDWLGGPLVIPVLGQPLGEVLDGGELDIQCIGDRGEFEVVYHTHRLPLDPATYPDLLDAAVATWRSEFHGSAGESLASLVDALRRLPPRNDPAPARQAERQREVPRLKRRLAAVLQAHPHLHDGIAAGLRSWTSSEAARDALRALLDRQAWRLAFWQVGGEEINYRRFFDVADLAALRMERSDVFEAIHAKILEWVADGKVDGLRVDHPDGLSDPAAYFDRLQRRCAESGATDAPVYIAVEKILADGEPLPAGWPVAGDTGYRFSNEVNGLFVEARHADAFDRIHTAFTGQDASFDAMLRDCKRLVMATSLAADLERLTRRLHEIAQREPRPRDLTVHQLRRALGAVAAEFEVYRTYIAAQGPSEADRGHVASAVQRAKAESAAAVHPAIDYLSEVLLTAHAASRADDRAARLAFVARWQQFTAPVQAKAMEDTAFYRYHCLISLNDVGGDPRRFGLSVAEFHAANLERARETPHTMLATSTHDSKRSEDVRCRIDVLSEMPAAWHSAVQAWSAAAQGPGGTTEAGIDAGTQYLVYQTLVGMWPFHTPNDSERDVLRQRLQACLLKSAREAKSQTSWLAPSSAFEARLTQFIDGLFDNAPGAGRAGRFLPMFEAWIRPVAFFGAWNSLAQVLLKLTSPGVPDVYQGCETWNFSLVDPDNRRPVDFDALARHLIAARSLGNAETLRTELAQALPDGRLKTWLTATLLHARKSEPRLFAQGRYLPLIVEGPAAANVVAFAREWRGRWLVVAAPRLLSGLCQHDPQALTPAVWRGTRIRLPAQVPPVSANVMGARRPAVVHAGMLDLEALFDPIPVAAVLCGDPAHCARKET